MRSTRSVIGSMSSSSSVRHRTIAAPCAWRPRRNRITRRGGLLQRASDRARPGAQERRSSEGNPQPMEHLDADAGSPAASTTQSVTTDAIDQHRSDRPAPTCPKRSSRLTRASTTVTTMRPVAIAAKRRRGSTGCDERAAHRPRARQAEHRRRSDDAGGTPRTDERGPPRRSRPRERALVRRPQIGDTSRRHVATPRPGTQPVTDGSPRAATGPKRRKRRGIGRRTIGGGSAPRPAAQAPSAARRRRRRPRRRRARPARVRRSAAGARRDGAGPRTQSTPSDARARRGRERNGRPIGRYLMCRAGAPGAWPRWRCSRAAT